MLRRSVNIPVRVVRNEMARGVEYQVGDDVITGGTTHCLVYVEGAWRIINQLWGSQSVRREESDEWELVAGDKMVKHRGEDEVRLYIYISSLFVRRQESKEHARPWSTK